MRTTPSTSRRWENSPSTKPGAIQHEEWSYGERRYFSDISMRKLVHTLNDHAEPARPELYLTA